MKVARLLLKVRGTPRVVVGGILKNIAPRTRGKTHSNDVVGHPLKVVVFVSGKNEERNPAFGELSAQMRGTGVENASRARRAAKTRAPNSPKNGRC